MWNFQSLCFSLLLMINGLYADDVAYHFSVSNKHPYIKEAILLEANLTQLDKTNIMLFNFSLKKSDDYTFSQVGFSEDEKHHDLHESYLYLVYPKKSGKIFIEFEMIKSITSDANVAYAISGDRDNVKGLEKEDFVVNLKPLALEIKSLPKGTELVGDFTLTHTLDKKETEAYDPINLSVKLKGEGFLESFELLKESKSYKLFTQNPKLKIAHSKMGSKSTLEWDYAVSAKENFSLPKVALKAFNPKTQKSYTLGFPAYDINVKAIEASTLLDKEDFPARAKGVDWNFGAWLFSYVMVFVAGLLMPRDLFKRRKKVNNSSEDILKEKIEKAKTHKALLDMLLFENNAKFSKAIDALEGVVYNGENISLVKIKKMI